MGKQIFIASATLVSRFGIPGIKTCNLQREQDLIKFLNGDSGRILASFRELKSRLL